MTINEKLLSEFGANLLGRSILPATLDRDIRWPAGAIKPWISSNRRWGFKALTLTFEFKGGHKTIETNKSKLVRELAECDIQFVSGGRNYHCALIGTDVADQVYGFELLEVEMLGYAYDPQVTATVTNGQTINLESTADTPVILTLTATSSEAIHIKGLGRDIALSGLSSGQIITIDGEKGAVRIGAENAYVKYDSWSFPHLKPGANVITITPEVALTIQYMPRWL